MHVEVEAFIVVNGDDVRHIAQREVRRRVDECRLIALRVPGVHSPDAARFLLRCECEVTIDYGPDPKAVRRIVQVFTSARHMVPALQTHPKWQRLSPVVMDGPNILRVADRYGDLAINPWSECQFLLATWRPLVPGAMSTVPAPVVPLDELLWEEDSP